VNLEESPIQQNNLTSTTRTTKLRNRLYQNTPRGVILEFSKMAVSLKWILDYFVGYTLTVRKYQYFCRFELENMSIYEIYAPGGQI
jgi:hypothetical protein